MTKAEEILKKEITTFEWGKENDKKLIPYEDALKAVEKAINYTHCCESDSEQLFCSDCNIDLKKANGFCPKYIDCEGLKTK